MDCCGYDEMFGPKTAEREARRYRRKGPHRTARRILGSLQQHGVAGGDVLEVGGGIGVIGIELLAAGAHRATNVELSSSYEDAARELLRERGLEGRFERRIGDFVADHAVPEADVVVLDRVVCCYPDATALVTAAARRARRTLVLTYPRYGLVARAAVRAINLALRLRRCAFRTYAHRPETIAAAAAARGLRPAGEPTGLVWRLAAFERA